MSLTDEYWICASDKFLLNIQKEKYKGEYYGKWIWPHAYVRAYLRRKINIPKSVKYASVSFFCDNEFDLYINKYAVDTEDVSHILKRGENMISIRAFQSNNMLQYTSAICGKLHVVYTDDSEETFYTDENWYTFLVSDFYDTEEPPEWLVKDDYKKGKMICTDIHPYFLRHSLYFRKGFYIEKELSKVILRATAKGLYKPFINGVCITEEKFLPGAMELVTEYQKFDITEFVNRGKNVIGFISGNGWYNCESWGELSANKNLLLFEIEVIYNDGTKDYICSDDKCEVALSPYEENDLQFGERYNANKEISDWCNDLTLNAGWGKVEVLYNLDITLIKQSYESIKVKKYLTAENIVKTGENCYLLDFGKTVSGRVRLGINGAAAGDRIVIKYFERFYPENRLCDGTYVPVYFPQDAHEKAKWLLRNTDVYICNGRDGSVYESEFTYTGFRYILIEGLRFVDKDTLRAAVMYNDLEETGEIYTDYKPVMELWDIIKRGYRSNIQGGPTDCPTREKNFWNGDIQTYSPSACWYMNNREFLTKWNLYGRKMEPGVYGWEDEEYILPWTLYSFYGDKSILKNKFTDILNLAKKREKDEVNGLTNNAHAPYRDHLSTQNVPSDFFADCYYSLMWLRISQIADILGERTVAQAARNKRKRAEEEFHKKYYLEDKYDYTPACQGAIVLAMAFELTPKKLREKTAETLNNYIIKNKYHLSTGFMSTPWILGILCDYGYVDTAWRLINQQEYPSWRYILKTGATAFTENWEGYTTSDPYASMNHYSYGAVSRWFFEYLGGIRVFESKPGLKKLVIKPTIIKQMSSFEVRYRTDYGIICSGWEVKGDSAKIKVFVPGECSADILLPDGEKISCEEGCFTFYCAI